MVKRLEEVRTGIGTEVPVDEHEVLDQDGEEEQDEPLCVVCVSSASNKGGNRVFVFGNDKMA